MGILDTLPTPEDMYRERAGRPISKGKTRLQETVEARPLTKVDEKKFRTDVIVRDRHRCRCCGRKVTATLGRVPERQEVHHIHGRVGDLRFESRAAVLLCLQCHEKVTGKVNQHRLTIVASKTFVTRQGTFCDARHPITFVEVG